MNSFTLGTICRKIISHGVFCALAAAFVAPVLAQEFIARQSLVGRFFFSVEERNVLEAVRQGVVDPAVLRTEDEVFIVTEIELPDIVFKVKKDIETNTFSRDQALHYGGIIRKSSDENADIFVNGLRISSDEMAQIEEELGIRFRTDRDDGSILFAEDVLFKNNIALRRGDMIEEEGAVVNTESGGGRSAGKRFIVLKNGS